MITFYIIALILVFLTAGFIFYPLIKNKQQTHEQAYTLSNTRLIKQRLFELDEEYAQGVISDKHRQQAKKELKLTLIDETQDIDWSTAHESSIQTKTIGYSILGLLLVSVSVIYWHVSHVDDVGALIRFTTEHASINSENYYRPLPRRYHEGCASIYASDTFSYSKQ